MRACADGGLKRALVHHNHRIREMRVVRCRVAWQNTGCLDSLSKRIPAFECALATAYEWLAPKPLNDGAIGVASVYV
jgi:hypothetical protein